MKLVRPRQIRQGDDLIVVINIAFWVLIVVLVAGSLPQSFRPDRTGGSVELASIDMRDHRAFATITVRQTTDNEPSTARRAAR